MTIKILQINVGRAYAAWDMPYATVVQRNVNILVVCEPNKKRNIGMNCAKSWITIYGEMHTKL